MVILAVTKVKNKKKMKTTILMKWPTLSMVVFYTGCSEHTQI